MPRHHLFTQPEVNEIVARERRKERRKEHRKHAGYLAITEQEAERIFEHLRNISADWTFDKLDREIADKLAHYLNPPPIEQD